MRCLIAILLVALLFSFPAHAQLKNENLLVTIPEGYYFVVGDNRPGSSDSREFGPVSKYDFIGQAFLRYWPTTTAGIIPHPTYDF